MLPENTTHIVAALFFQSPNKHYYLKEISRQTHIAHTSIIRALKTLLKTGMIKKTIEERGTRAFPYYHANLESPAYYAEKRIHNLRAVLESKLITTLKEELAPTCIILFGSYLRGEDDEESDIDLFIEGTPQELNLATYEKELHRKIQLHIRKSFKKLPKELKNNISNGITLQGFLEGY